MTKKLRIGAWNSLMGTEVKLSLIERVGEVVVVPESLATPVPDNRSGVSFSWKGPPGSRGLGVFAFGGYQLHPLDAPAELEWVLPLRVLTPEGASCFNLLAVWTVVGRGRPTYEGQVQAMIREWTPLLRHGPWAIAGDLNALPTQRQHVQNLADLGALGIRSSYHHLTGAPHGEESEKTLRWHGKGFHPDFVFLSDDLMKRASSVEVGSMADWVDSGRSDHCPITVSLTA